MMLCVRQRAAVTVPVSLLLFLSVAPNTRAQSPGDRSQITLNPDERHQFIQGFGVNFTSPYFRDDQKAMFDMLIKDLGATMFRVVPYLVYSNWEEVNDNNDANVMNWEYYNERYSTPVWEASWNALRFLNSRGIRPIIALMGPVPDWMVDDHWTPPKHKVCQTDSKQFPLKPAMYDEFAEMVVSMVMYARTKAGIDFEYFSPFNETDCYPPEGPRIDPEEAPKVLAAVARRLKKEGLGDIKLTPADQAVITNDYISPILNDPELMKQVGAFTLHTYGENSVGPQVERVTNSRYAHVPVWLTEYGDLHDQDKTAENDWKNFSLASNRRALTALNQGASAVFFFDAFDDYEECARRLTFYGLFRSADHLYAPKKRYYATRQLYHFVPPGSHRIGAIADIPGLTVSAFHDGNSAKVIVVGVKESGPNKVAIKLPLSAGAVASWELYMTTRTTDCVKVGTIAALKGTAELELPDEAVFTLVGILKK
jgi:O-glycosyl hydrolase